MSLLLLPIGRETLLEHLAGRITAATGRKPSVVCTFPAAAGYDALLRRSGLVEGNSIEASDFSARVAGFEPSDWLLLVEPRCFPLDGLDVSLVLHGLEETPRLARHMIALSRTMTGTNERVEFDMEQRVRRVQRYYDDVTWTVGSGVCCSMIPVSSLAMVSVPTLSTLSDLRQRLVSRFVPSLDIALPGAVADLGVERGLLSVAERYLMAETAADDAEANRHAVHPSARFVGAVVLHPDVTVEEGVTVVGPAVIGAGATIGRGAVVAQSIVAPGVVVPAGQSVRHRVVAHADQADSFDSTVLDDTDDVTPLLEPEPVRRFYPYVKLALEVTIAAIALILLLPILVIVAVLVKLDSRGPIFYGDPREARGGRMFRCYKFRTMRVGAAQAQRELAMSNQMDGPQFKMGSDPRVTRVGTWLRKTSIDELPQLFNVALGQMSLVGPRPSPFRENQLCVPWREARLSIRPGITGLWQVCRHQRESGDFHQWIYYDLQYIRHMSLMVDLRIIAATLWTMGGKTHVPLSWIISRPKEVL